MLDVLTNSNENAMLTMIPQVEIYTDGGCEPNPGPGGYGVGLLHPKKRAEASGGFRLAAWAWRLCVGKLSASIRVDQRFDSAPHAGDGVRHPGAGDWRQHGLQRLEQPHRAQVAVMET